MASFLSASDGTGGVCAKVANQLETTLRRSGTTERPISWPAQLPVRVVMNSRVEGGGPQTVDEDSVEEQRPQSRMDENMPRGLEHGRYAECASEGFLDIAHPAAVADHEEPVCRAVELQGQVA